MDAEFEGLAYNGLMRIYLDNAATSWPKPEPVYAAVDRYQRDIGAAAGRGGYREAVEAQRAVDAARRGCAALLGVEDPRRIVFTANGTDALNLAIHGLLRPADHVITTVCEHNSVLRPLAEASHSRDVHVSIIGCDETGVVDLDELKKSLRPNTRLLAITHASNVTGAVQPVAEAASLAHAAGALVLVDAAQTAGHLPVDVKRFDADLLAASGHKGLLGPLGTGLLYVREGLEPELAPVRQGGTGIDSQSDRQPNELPWRYEAGNLNTPALAGMAAAVQFLNERSVREVAAHESALIERLLNGLSEIKTARIYGPQGSQVRAAVVSFTIEGYDPQEFAAALDSSCGVQCRAGLHCAPRMHQALGTDAIGGTVRFSVGWSTTDKDVDSALRAVAAIAES
jgi:cysteine desulfurase / selenocysteine lyase